MADKIKQKERVKTVKKLAKKESNKECFNCRKGGPQNNVCLTFNTFVCSDCAGLHRNFNHRVKSINMSTFTAKEVKELKDGGNKKARKEWMAKPLNYKVQPGNNDSIKQFMEKLYINKEWHVSKLSPEEQEKAKKKKKKKKKKVEEDESKESEPIASKKSLSKLDTSPQMTSTTSEIPDLLSSFDNIDFEPAAAKVTATPSVGIIGDDENEDNNDDDDDDDDDDEGNPFDDDSSDEEEGVKEIDEGIKKDGFEFETDFPDSFEASNSNPAAKSKAKDEFDFDAKFDDDSNQFDNAFGDNNDNNKTQSKSQSNDLFGNEDPFASAIQSNTNNDMSFPSMDDTSNNNSSNRNDNLFSDHVEQFSSHAETISDPLESLVAFLQTSMDKHRLNKAEYAGIIKKAIKKLGISIQGENKSKNTRSSFDDLMNPVASPTNSLPIMTNVSAPTSNTTTQSNPFDSVPTNNVPSNFMGSVPPSNNNWQQQQAPPQSYGQDYNNIPSNNMGFPPQPNSMGFPPQPNQQQPNSMGFPPQPNQQQPNSMGYPPQPNNMGFPPQPNQQQPNSMGFPPQPNQFNQSMQPMDNNDNNNAQTNSNQPDLFDFANPLGQF